MNLKTEWWCEPLGCGWVDICVTFGKRLARWTVPTDLMPKECEAIFKAMFHYAHAVPLAVVREVADSTVVFPSCPKPELTQLEWEVFYPQGLFYMDEAPQRNEKRYLVRHDEPSDKQLKFTPPVGKGPRGRWG